MSLHDSLTQAVVSAADEVLVAEDELTTAKHRLQKAERDLTDAMHEGTVPAMFRAHGYSWILDEVRAITPESKEHSEAVCQWIVANGGESLNKPAIHHATRDKFLREVCIDAHDEVAIPEGLTGLVKVFDNVRVKRVRV